MTLLYLALVASRVFSRYLLLANKILNIFPLQATANVDAETDREMQEVIQQCLGDRTVITIAHRVDTVLGCDRVLVMEQGNIVEAGPPNTLLRDATSKFSRFVSN